MGFGIGAASLVENVRFCNGRDLKTYLDRPLECGEDMEVLNPCMKPTLHEVYFI